MSKTKYILKEELETNKLYTLEDLKESHLDITYAARVTKKKRGLDIELSYYCYEDGSERLALAKNFWVLDVSPKGSVVVQNQKDYHKENDIKCKDVKEGIKTLLSKL